MNNYLLRYFGFSRTSKSLNEIAQPFYNLAHQMDSLLPDSSEKTTLLRKLLESQDAGFRAALDKEESSEPPSFQAGKAWSDIAASAYKAYAASTGGKNFQGNPMPVWHDLPAPIRVAWEAAARQVGECVNNHDMKIPDESHWSGWLPP